MTRNFDRPDARLTPGMLVAGFFAACILAACLLPPVVQARETANGNSAAWCARRAPAGQQPQCLQAETRCRAALPDLAPAGGCPDRQLDRCAAQHGDDGGWCAILCCYDPDHPACRAAADSMPDIFAPTGH